MGFGKYSYCSMQPLKQLPIIKTKYDASVRGVTPQQYILSLLKGNVGASRIQRPQYDAYAFKNIKLITVAQ